MKFCFPKFYLPFSTPLSKRERISTITSHLKTLGLQTQIIAATIARTVLCNSPLDCYHFQSCQMNKNVIKFGLFPSTDGLNSRLRWQNKRNVANLNPPQFNSFRMKGFTFFSFDTPFLCLSACLMDCKKKVKIVHLAGEKRFFPTIEPSRKSHLLEYAKTRH